MAFFVVLEVVRSHTSELNPLQLIMIDPPGTPYCAEGEGFLFLSPLQYSLSLDASVTA